MMRHAFELHRDGRLVAGATTPEGILAAAKTIAGEEQWAPGTLCVVTRTTGWQVLYEWDGEHLAIVSASVVDEPGEDEEAS
jgi:hypothetical protein